MNKLLIGTSLTITFLSLSILYAVTKSTPKPNGETKMENNHSYVTELTEENAQALIANVPLLLIIDFYADWCAPCKNLKPIFEDLAQEFKNQYAFAKINVDKCPEVAKKYNISGLPTILIINKGQVISSITGLVSKETLLEKIQEAVNGPKDLTSFTQEELNNKLLQAVQAGTTNSEIKRILDAGADVNAKDANGMSALMAVIFIQGSRGIDVSELIKILLSHGAQTEFADERTGQKMTASDCAAMMAENYKKLAANFETIAKVLKEEQAQANKKMKCDGTSCTL